MNKRLKEIIEKFDGLDDRLKSVELYVKWVRGEEGYPIYEETRQTQAQVPERDFEQVKLRRNRRR